MSNATSRWQHQIRQAVAAHTPLTDEVFDALPLTDEALDTLAVRAGTRTDFDAVAGAAAAAEIRELRAQRDYLLVALKAVEWGGGRNEYCGNCGSHRRLEGHRRGCVVGAAIARAEGA